MRTFLCLSCGEIFSEVVENKDYIMGNSYGSLAYLCPKIDCSGNVIEIDDFMISSIRNLNHLGFEMTCVKFASKPVLLSIKTSKTLEIQDFFGF